MLKPFDPKYRGVLFNAERQESLQIVVARPGTLDSWQRRAVLCCRLVFVFVLLLLLLLLSLLLLLVVVVVVVVIVVVVVVVKCLLRQRHIMLYSVVF